MTLELTGLSTGYGRTTVVHGVDLTVPDGGLTAVLGHNGAGKTTLLRAVLGLLPARAGTVRLAGTDVTGWPPHRRVRRGIAYVPQGQQSFGQLTARENLQVVADAYGAAGRRRTDEALNLFPALGPLLGRQAGLLSGGQRQQLAIARALVTGPRLLVLDEPTEGIQPNVVREIYDAITDLSSGGELSVLLVEQHIGYAVEHAGEYLVMTSGRITHRAPGGAAAVHDAREAMAL
ncbi:urea ABC transporter ATP-binding protein [Isoptericola sp. CG 20/1183]|uniref:Urea ABC transporter ATP-binding protein n=1 Tax=Isoptericola halotolerans TaxID=300560 RepID=A0ABX5EE91_9MICO|nr:MULTISPECIES: ATP-binding cassette domain-containing protein [Isoptericola]MCK0117923.1 ATP-binding cassette domain-containing protein [Isoptericola sp. S6320L]PRZ07004.1 urea ABC transporter ATP-binding protein [Isoptericola halotolerans]PRZ07324.1 urea ABC transporter ATP-binding protein [Isoptericola sp. CG 20/1183]